MNDLGLPNWNSVIHLDRQDRPAVERETQDPLIHHPRARRRRGGRLFAVGGLLLLAGGLSLDEWGYHSRDGGLNHLAGVLRNILSDE